MCGCFNLHDNPAVRALFTSLGVPLPALNIFNFRPTDSVAVIASRDGELALMDARWWLVPSWSTGPSNKFTMFNARVESVASSRAYATPFKRQRGIIPASSFVEWQKQGEQKQAMEISSASGAMAFAAVWDIWSGAETVVSCSMLTTAATPAFAPIHKRMPVMLGADQLQPWLDPASSKEALIELCLAGSGESLQATPVHRRIGNSSLKQAPEPIAGAVLQISPE